MKITIVGGGNIGTLMAAEFAAKGNEVAIFTSAPDKFEKILTVVDNDGAELLKGEIFLVTDDICAAAEAEYIFVTLPSVAQSSFAKKLAPHIKKGTRIGMVPGYGGAEFVMNDVVAAGAELFGFQRVHAIARIDKYGKRVVMKGRKDSLFLAAMDNDITNDLCGVMSELFDMPCIALPNYLCVTLTPSNPILHTSRLYGMFNDYSEETIYSDNIPFYEKWTDFDSEILFGADKELQIICRTMKRADLSSVRSLLDHYESHTVQHMTNKISSIQAFRGILSPMIRNDKGWKPDFDSRYFTCDFAYGLDLIVQFGDIVGVETPIMNEMMRWYRKVSGDSERIIDIRKYGVDSLEAVYKFYNVK